MNKHRVWFLVSLAAAFFAAQITGLAAVGISVSPTSVSNTYTGFITLNISGLSTGGSVKVQTFLDSNSNGVVDPGEPLLDVFAITDNSTIGISGGVTNVNVAIDGNKTNGAITTVLSFALPIENVVGQKIYRVISDPPGGFTPATAIFNVTNSTLGQSFNGTVFEITPPGTTPVAVPGSVVVALEGQNDDYAGAAMADAGGHYSLSLSPGSYQLFAFASNAYADLSQSANVTLAGGVIVTTNLFVTNASTTISGQFSLAGTSTNLGGVFVQLSSGNFTAIAFSDTNGNYSAGVTPAKWGVEIPAERLARRALVGLHGNQKIDASGGSVANANFAFPEADAIIFGTVTIPFGTPVPNIQINANDSLNIYKASGFSDSNGDYAVAVIGTNATDPWTVQPGDGSLNMTNFVFTTPPSVVIPAHQGVEQDISLLRVTTTISGRVQDNLGNPLAGIQMFASAPFNSTNFNTDQAFTDTNGNYSLGVSSGTWSVVANCCGDGGLDSFGLFDPAQSHQVPVPPEDAILNITTFPIGTPFVSAPKKFSSTTFAFTLMGTVGSNYTIQAATNISGKTPNWFTVFQTNLANGSALIQDTHATNAQRFYRVMLGP